MVSRRRVSDSLFERVDVARLPYLVALRKPRDRQIRIWGLSVVIVALASVSGCSAIPGGGPGRISATALETNGIEIVTITNAVSEKLVRMQRRGLFSEALGSDGALLYTVGRGDTLEVSVWEAPPALLFGASPADLRANGAPLRATTFPEQVVSAQGTINIPFVGVVPVEGRALQDVESDIVERLKGKANQAQATVRLVRNSSLNVTIVGEVASSLRMPLTPRGERLLDALAAAGGDERSNHSAWANVDAAVGDNHPGSGAERSASHRRCCNSPSPAAQPHCARRSCKERRT